MGESFDDAAAALVEAARDAADARLVVSTSGNISVRFGSDSALISSSGSRLGKLHVKSVVAVDLVSGALREEVAAAEPDARPSIETPMHLAVYRSRSEVRSVLHFQSAAATALACRSEDLPDLNIIPEFSAYIRKVARVPYHAPGTDELAEAITAELADSDVRVVVMTNHGQIAIGETPAQAVSRAAFFELACGIRLASEGRQMSTFSPAEIERLRRY
jgi:L-fuculose-phosphate aldolase